MPQICCVVQCSHTSYNCRLKRFPSDKKRSSTWEAYIRRKDWKRKEHHRICECHFDSHQFELNRSDGNRKLCRDAVPLIFPTHRICGQNAFFVQKPVGADSASLAVSTEPSCIGASSEKVEVHNDDVTAKTVNQASIASHEPVGASSASLAASCKPSCSGASNGNQASTESHDVSPKGFISLEEHEKIMADMKTKLQRKIYCLQKARLREETRYHNLVASLNDLFTADQIQHLSQKKIGKWSKESVRKGLQIRYACGVKGYKQLIKQGFPLPSYQSLCRRVQKISLDPGVSEMTVQLMAAKGRTMNRKEKFVVLSVDEMEIRSKLEFDIGRKRVVGYTTLGHEGNRASKLLLLVARGLTTKWKQPIGWHLTDGSTVTGPELQAFILEGVQQMEEADYHVIGCVSDMGSENMSMWKSMGITVGRWSLDKMSISHPCRPDEDFYIFADVCHVLKNIRSGFLTHDIHLPDHTVKKYNLPTSTVSYSWILKYLNDESTKDTTIKLAPHLINSSVTAPTSFEKMKVFYAAKLMSHNTANALRTAVHHNVLAKDALTTAWFIDSVAKWFGTATGRHLRSSITMKNIQVKCEELTEFAELMREIKTSDGRWKPFQKGAILSTYNLVSLVSNLLNSGSVSYVLTSRFTQDALENIFSSIRYRGTVLPSPLQALRAVRLLSVALFTCELKNVNYEVAEDSSYIDFLASPVKKKEKTVQEEPLKLTSACSRLHPLEEDALHHYTGRVVAKIWNNICISCRNICHSSPNDILTIDVVCTKLKDFGGLKHASEIALTAARLLERFCCTNMDTMFQNNDYIVERLCSKVISSVECILPKCACNLVPKFSKAFINSRLQFRLSDLNATYRSQMRKRKLYSTKSGNDVAVKKFK